jgi:hypothetical protein
MKPSLMLTTLVAILFAAAIAQAGEGVTVMRLPDAGSRGPAALDIAKVDCLLGNLNPPVSVVPGYFSGAEGYKYLIFPPDQCACQVGFILEKVNMMLEFTAPATFEVITDLSEAIWDPAAECWIPGPELCTSLVHVVDIPAPGTYVISVPIEFCECAWMPYHYFLGMHFLTLFEANLVIDAFPMPCVAYNDKGAGWVDLFNWFIKSNGKVIIWGDVICCEQAIGNEANTWGRVKGLYR